MGTPGYILLKRPTKLTKIWEWVYISLNKKKLIKLRLKQKDFLKIPAASEIVP